MNDLNKLEIQTILIDLGVLDHLKKRKSLQNLPNRILIQIGFNFYKSCSLLNGKENSYQLINIINEIIIIIIITVCN